MVDSHNSSGCGLVFSKLKEKNILDYISLLEHNFVECTFERKIQVNAKEVRTTGFVLRTQMTKKGQSLFIAGSNLFSSAPSSAESSES